MRLYADDVCASCHATAAWHSYESGKLVITREQLTKAHSRRTGAAGAGVLRRGRPWLLAAVSAVLAVVSLRAVFGLFGSVAVGPLGTILGIVSARSVYAVAVGGPTFVAVSVLLLWSRKRRRIRSPLMLVGHVTAVLAGATAATLGCLGLVATSGGIGMRYTEMPPIVREIGRSTVVERIMKATVVIVAPDEDGDAKLPSLGSGVVIAGVSGAAWIATNSHVAMPYADVGSFRNAKDARTVWVEFADGRGRHGTVRWVAPPPIDIAVLRVEIDDPPAAVPVAGDAREVRPGTEVSFVPNPYRRGWLLHRGQVLERELHKTPVGECSVVYSALPVQPGDSGSGLFNEFGELVGINTWTIRGAAPRGISLPSETMRKIVDAIKKHNLELLTAVEGESP